MEPPRRSHHESELYKRLLAVVDRCDGATRREQVIDCFEVMELADVMINVAEEAYELLLVKLGFKIVPSIRLLPIIEIVDKLQQRFAELSADGSINANWAEVAAVTLVTKLWTIGEALAVEHAKSRANQFKAFPTGLINLVTEHRKRMSIVSVWTSEPGACEICQFLNGSVITNLFDDGPPAHPRCRCRLEHAVEIAP